MRVNESGIDLDVKNTVNTVDTSNILLKSLIIKVNEGDSDESSEDINDDSYFDSSNDDNVLISTMYESRDETMWLQNSSELPKGCRNVKALVQQCSRTKWFTLNEVNNAPDVFIELVDLNSLSDLEIHNCWK